MGGEPSAPAEVEATLGPRNVGSDVPSKPLQRNKNDKDLHDCKYYDRMKKRGKAECIYTPIQNGQGLCKLLLNL